MLSQVVIQEMIFLKYVMVINKWLLIYLVMLIGSILI